MRQRWRWQRRHDDGGGGDGGDGNKEAATPKKGGVCDDDWGDMTEEQRSRRVLGYNKKAWNDKKVPWTTKAGTSSHRKSGRRRPSGLHKTIMDVEDELEA